MGKSTRYILTHQSEHVDTWCNCSTHIHVSGDSTGTTEGTGDAANTYDTNASNMNFTTWSDDADYSNDDFSLTLTSPAVDSSGTGFPSDDYAGTARPQGSAADDGAYEFVPTGGDPP